MGRCLVWVLWALIGLRGGVVDWGRSDDEGGVSIRVTTFVRFGARVSCSLFLVILEMSCLVRSDAHTQVTYCC